jgi:hypothetical protein
MSAHKILILVAALFTLAAGATEAPKKRSLSTVEVGVKAYNLIQGASKLILAMKLGSRADDANYLDGLVEKYKNERLPIAKMKNGDIYLQGLPFPIKIVDIKEGTFSYKGRTFDINMKDGAEATFDALDAIVNPKPFAFMSWVLPQADAQSNSVAAVVGILGVCSAVYGADQCLSDDGSQVGCGVGSLLGGFGIGYCLAALENRPAPTGMVCYPGQNGCSQVVLNGPRGPSTIMQCPGQALNYNPALAQIPAAVAPRMGMSLVEMCSYPSTMTLMNTAYMQPLPAMYQAPVAVAAGTPALPLGSPGIPLVNGRPPVVLPAAAKPAVRTPATAFRQPIEAVK